MKKISNFKELNSVLSQHSYCWLITGVAGFIGSNLLEYLLKNNQFVIGIDNLSTGYLKNLEYVQSLNPEIYKQNFSFINGDICNLSDCNKAFYRILCL